MFRGSVGLVVALLACGCSSDAPRGELALYDWEAQRASPNAQGANNLRCRPDACPDFGAKRIYVVGVPTLTDDDIARESVGATVDPQTGGPVVYMQFTHDGQKRFGELTRKLARRGMRKKSPQHFLVVVDDVVYASPYIDFKVNPDGIPGDNGMQVDVPSLGEARDLAKALRG